MALVAEARDVVKAHVETLVGQLAQIITGGIARGEFAVADPVVAARAVFDATARFHNPVHAAEWSDPGIDAAFDGVWALLFCGLGAQRDSARSPKQAAVQSGTRPKQRVKPAGKRRTKL